MAVQIIRAPNGEEMIVMPRADYEALLAGQYDPEDDADIAMFDARMAELAGGTISPLPAEVSASILAGDTRLKAIRKWRGLPQALLAERAGIGQGYLSEIESGRKAGAADKIDAIAKVLDVPADWFA